jgi:hypothetical protein
MPEQNRTHIVHDRRNGHPFRTIGYRVTGHDGRLLNVVAAETRCHPNDNFDREEGRKHVYSRLKSYQAGARSPDLRAFEADIAMDVPTNNREYRELEQTLLELADIRLPLPAALRE